MSKQRLTYSFWNMTNQSASISLMSIVFPLTMTAGCFLLINHPTWEKKNPLLALCGSASVSLYLWCCLWSLTQMYRQFYKEIIKLYKNKYRFWWMRWKSTNTSSRQDLLLANNNVKIHFICIRYYNTFRSNRTVWYIYYSLFVICK